MTLDDFATITPRVIQRDGFNGYLPTVCFPARDHIIVLEGVPEEKEPQIRDIALAWARDEAQGEEEYLLAYKEDSDHFRIVRKSSDQHEERVFAVLKAEPGVAPNGGPAAPFGNSGAVEEPPSVT